MKRLLAAGLLVAGCGDDGGRGRGIVWRRVLDDVVGRGSNEQRRGWFVEHDRAAAAGQHERGRKFQL